MFRLTFSRAMFRSDAEIGHPCTALLAQNRCIWPKIGLWGNGRGKRVVNLTVGKMVAAAYVGRGGGYEMVIQPRM